MKHFYPRLAKHFIGMSALLLSLNSLKAQDQLNDAAEAVNIYSYVNATEIQGVLTASFSVNSDKQCVGGNTFIFTNSSSAGTYSWDFGDGTVSSGTSPVKSYTKSGNYKVRLEVKNGADFVFAEQFVEVQASPVVSFTTLAGTLNGNSYTFISTSTIESGAMSYAWDFGDGTYSTLVNPTKAFAAAAAYSVKLVVASNNGCKDSLIKVIATGTPPPPACVVPVASFTLPAQTVQCRNGNKFALTNTSTLTTGTLSYIWDFGDNSFSAATSPTKSFNDTGTFIISLVAINDNGGCSARTSKSIKITGPFAAFVVNPTSLQCFNGNSFKFTNQSHCSDSKMTYKWSDDAAFASTETNPVKSYILPATYNMKLVVNATVTGCSDTLVRALTVYPSPKAAFTTALAASTDTTATIQFTNASTISGASINYEWYFGDGHTEVLANPLHVFTKVPEIKTIKLIANTSNGCKDSMIKTTSMLTGISVTVPVVTAPVAAILPPAPNDQLLVYPNPAISSARIIVTTPANTSVLVLKIMDRNGRLISETRQATSLTPNTLITLNTQNLTAGTYFVEVTTGNGVRVGKSIIIKG